MHKSRHMINHNLGLFIPSLWCSPLRYKVTEVAQRFSIHAKKYGNGIWQNSSSQFSQPCIYMIIFFEKVLPIRSISSDYHPSYFFPGKFLESNSVFSELMETYTQVSSILMAIFVSRVINLTIWLNF